MAIETKHTKSRLNANITNIKHKFNLHIIKLVNHMQYIYTVVVAIVGAAFELT